MRRLSACLAVLALSACGGGMSTDEFEQSLRRSLCAGSVRCGYHASEADCAAAINLGLDDVKARVKAGKVRFDSAAAADCIAFNDAATCSQTFNTPASRCEQTFKGALDIGGACSASVECASGNCDRNACAGDQCCLGTCVPGPKLAAWGGDCTDGNTVCPAGTFCGDYSAEVRKTCRALTKEGEGCDNSLCASGLACVQIGTGVSHVCTRLPGRGEICNLSGLFCDSTRDFCDPETLTCVEKHGPGGACGPEISCVAWAYCDRAAQKCVALPKRGERCADGDCQEGLSCDDSDTCALIAEPPPPVCPQLTAAGTAARRPAGSRRRCSRARAS